MIERIKDEVYFATRLTRAGILDALDYASKTVEQQPFSTFGGLMVGFGGGLVIVENLADESQKTAAEIAELKDQNTSLVTAQHVLDQGNLPQTANDQAQYALDMKIVSNNRQISTLQAQETNNGSATAEVASYVGIEVGMALVGAVALTAVSRGIRNRVLSRASDKF